MNERSAILADVPRPRGDVALDDLTRFSREVVEGSVDVDVLGPTERRLRWQIGGRSGTVTSAALRSGLISSVSTVAWDRPWSMSVNHGASAIKLILTRGPGPRSSTDDTEPRSLGGGLLHVGRITRPTRLTFDFGEPPPDAHHVQIALEVSRARLLELLGATELPAPIERVLAAPGAFPSFALPMGASLDRRFDEVLHCDARGASRPVHLEANGLELLAAMLDRVEESARAEAPISRHDTDRLERARALLLARIEAPPTLAELAREAGLNELKLKAGFRALFGSPVFAYLRAHRMREAERLLRMHEYTVTEVALRVGYANPSKFAAAFKRHFGVRPSDIR